MLLISGLIMPFSTDGGIVSTWLVSVLGILYLVGWAASAAGMRQLRATGDNLAGKIIFVIQMTGLLLAFSFNVQEIVNPNPDPDSLLFRVTDMAWPASHVFMLVLGFFVLAAGVWRGWRSVTPFLCGLALPAFFAVKALAGFELGGIVFGISTAIAFTLLGYAVRTGEPTVKSA
jgi:hypothetical protein